MSRCGRLIVVAVFAALLAGLVPGESSVRADESYDREELKLLDLLNGYREENGLAPLILSDALTRAAERHSEDMGRYGFFDHGTVKSSYFPVGSRSWDRMDLSGYDYEDASKSENLAAGIETAEKSLKAWRASPAHNRAMLDGDKKVVGIARVRVPGSKHGWYWTTDFGSRRDPTSHAPGEAGEEPASKRKKPEKKQASERNRALKTADKAQDREADGGGVENGSMDGKGAWEQKTNDNGKSLVEDGVARLGGDDDARDELFQKVRAREGQRLT